MVFLSAPVTRNDSLRNDRNDCLAFWHFFGQILRGLSFDINLVVIENYKEYRQETQLSLTNRATRLKVSQGHQT